MRTHPFTWRQALEFFFTEYLPRHRGVSPRTIESYAVALRLLVESIGRERSPCELEAPQVLDFLAGLEQKRRNQASSRNVRLAALKAFFRAMILRDAGNQQRYELLLQIPFKRCVRRSPDYFEPEELARLFRSVDARSEQGFRDLMILRYMYNTGARISEVANTQVSRLALSGQCEVVIVGKGGTCRTCPLWPTTAEMLGIYLRRERPKPQKGHEDFLLLTRLGKCFTRGGLWKLIRGHFDSVVRQVPSLQRKRLTPHSLRHTTAVHLLRAGVEINVIKAWLGHADVATTSHYLDLDLDKKREALERFLRLGIDRILPARAGSAVALPENVVSWLERL